MLQRIEISPDELRGMFGMGVAGNFAGHLEQAGEAADFVNVDAAASLPKGIFPWYVPGGDTFLSAYPLSSDLLAVPDPQGDHPLKIQIEPEMCLACDIDRDASGVIRGLNPRWIAAFDDCSLRRPGAARISEKKNWGAGSKGLASHGFPISNLDRSGPAQSLRLACFVCRGGTARAYGVDSAIPSYTLFGDELLSWLVERLQHQRAAPDTPLEDVGALLAACPDATGVLIGVGASRYTPHGETTFVEEGDEAVVVLYDATVHSPDKVEDAIARGADSELTAASVLRRRARRIENR